MNEILNKVCPRLKSDHTLEHSRVFLLLNIFHTVRIHSQVIQEVVRIRLADVASVQVESEESEGSPESNLPVDLPNQRLNKR